MNVTVTRGGRSSAIDVPIAELSKFRVLFKLGGQGRGIWFRYPRITALMSCAAIPDDDRATFGHSCMHGPPPHKIRVIVKLEGSVKRSADDACRLAREGEALAEAYRLGRPIGKAA